jgi:drug/metabolite transporter (DMT)-like permease
VSAARGAGISAGMAALLLGVMLFWGLNVPIVKAMAEVMDVVWVAVVRIGSATLTLTAVLLLRDRRFPRLDRRQWLWLGASAVLLIYLNQWLFVMGMRLASGTTASLVMAINPLLAVLAGALVFRERITAKRAAGVALGLAGVSLAVFMAPQAEVALPGQGELLIFLGQILFIGGGLMIQRLARDLDVLVIGWAVYVMGSLMLLANALVLGGWERTQAAFSLDWVWACALYAGVLGTALANVGWYHVIGKIGQSQASPHLYWLAVFGMLSSVLTLGESLSLWHGIGLALLVAGIRLGSAPVRLGAGA